MALRMWSTIWSGLRVRTIVLVIARAGVDVMSVRSLQDQSNRGRYSNRSQQCDPSTVTVWCHRLFVLVAHESLYGVLTPSGCNRNCTSVHMDATGGWHGGIIPAHGPNLSLSVSRRNTVMSMGSSTSRGRSARSSNALWGELGTRLESQTQLAILVKLARITIAVFCGD